MPGDGRTTASARNTPNARLGHRRCVPARRERRSGHLPIRSPANPSLRCRRCSVASIVCHASCARPAERRRRAISAAIFGTFLVSSSYCSMKASTSPWASAISVSARRTVLTRDRSAISSSYIGPEDDQPIFTRSFSAGFVTGRFDRSIIRCFRCSRPACPSAGAKTRISSSNWP